MTKKKVKKKSRPTKPSKIDLAINEIDKLKNFIKELEGIVCRQNTEIENITNRLNSMCNYQSKTTDRIENCSNRLERIENRFDCYTNGSGYKSGGGYGGGPGYSTNPFTGGGWR